MKHMTLESVADTITLGLHVSGQPSGDTLVISASELAANLGWIGRPARSIALPDSRSAKRSVVDAKDVVIVGRGAEMRVGLVPPSIAGAVVASNLIRITTRRSALLPGVLAAWLSSARGQHAVGKLSRSSSTLMSLRTSDLASLPVPVPGPAEQERIEALVIALADYRRSTDAAVALRQRLVSQALHTAFSGGGA